MWNLFVTRRRRSSGLRNRPWARICSWYVSSVLGLELFGGIRRQTSVMIVSFVKTRDVKAGRWTSSWLRTDLWRGTGWLLWESPRHQSTRMARWLWHLGQGLCRVLALVSYLSRASRAIAVPMMRPKARNKGTGTTTLSSWEIFMSMPIYLAQFIMPWWVRAAAFGAPVLPEVNCKFRTSLSEIEFSVSQFTLWGFPSSSTDAKLMKNGEGPMAGHTLLVSSKRTTCWRDGMSCFSFARHSL